MPDFSFLGWSASDLGMSSFFDTFGGGPFTVAGTADTVTITDGAGDTSFDDDPSEPTPDPGGDQVAAGDLIIDGVVVAPDGANVWNIGEFTVTNVTTGEVGTIIIFGDGPNSPIGAASTINFEIGDVITFTDFVVGGAEPYDGLVCLTTGTHIETERGQVPIEALRLGDRVKTQDNGLQAIRWIGQRSMDREELSQNANFCPVRITAGAVGDGLPVRDLLVSRQHRMLASSKIAQRMFDHPEVLVSAVKLTDLPGIFVDTDVESVTYFHMLFDQHEIVFAEGAPTESRFTGPEALDALDPASKAEVLSLFPEVTELAYAPTPARFIPHNRFQKKLVSRHLKNGHPIRMPIGG